MNGKKESLSLAELFFDGNREEIWNQDWVNRRSLIISWCSVHFHQNACQWSIELCGDARVTDSLFQWPNCRLKHSRTWTFDAGAGRPVGSFGRTHVWVCILGMLCG
jgi:hypothetical protein